MFQMLTSPKTSNVPIWPSLKTKEFVFPPSTAAGPSRASANISASSTMKNTNNFDSDADDEFNEDYARPLAMPSDSFGLAIAEALYQNSSLNNNNNKAAQGGKGKKKKNRNTVLFSMGGRAFDGN